jgi:hypothetical protein
MMTDRLSGKPIPDSKSSEERWEMEGSEKKWKERGSLHDIIDVLPQDVEWLGVDIGISDKRTKVDYLSALESYQDLAKRPMDLAYRLGIRDSGLTKQPQQMLSSINLRHWFIWIFPFLLNILSPFEPI